MWGLVTKYKSFEQRFMDHLQNAAQLKDDVGRAIDSNKKQVAALVDRNVTLNTILEEL